MKPWWPSFIVKPRVRLTRPRFGMPTRPPDIIIFGAIFVLVVFVLGGNIYTMVKTPPAIAGDSQGNPILVMPGISAQLGLEGIVASLVIIIGTFGLGLLYSASKYVFQPSHATRLMIIGVVLTGAAFLILTYIFAMKIGAFQS